MVTDAGIAARPDPVALRGPPAATLGLDTSRRRRVRKRPIQPGRRASHRCAGVCRRRCGQRLGQRGRAPDSRRRSAESSSGFRGQVWDARPGGACAADPHGRRTVARIPRRDRRGLLEGGPDRRLVRRGQGSGPGNGRRSARSMRTARSGSRRRAASAGSRADGFTRSRPRTDCRATPCTGRSRTTTMLSGSTPHAGWRESHDRTLDAWAAEVEERRGRDPPSQATMLDHSDGVRIHAMPGNYTPQVGKSRDGRLWFLPWDGVSVLDPRRLPFNALAPPVHIEQVTADRTGVRLELRGCGCHRTCATSRSISRR